MDSRFASLFVSPKKLIVQSSADPQIIVQKFRERIEKETYLKVIDTETLGALLSWNFFIKEGFMGTVDGRTITVQHYTKVKHSLQPTMHINIEDGASGGSVIQTRYSLSPFLTIFLCMHMTFAILGSIALSMYMSPTTLSVLLFPVCGILLLVLMRFLARENENRLEWLVKDVVAAAESERRGERLQI